MVNPLSLDCFTNRRKNVWDLEFEWPHGLEPVKALDEKVRAWNEIVRKYQGTPYEYLARVEEERLDRAKVVFVELNRQRLKEGSQLVILGYSQLITKHRESKNVHRHFLDFGDYYVKLAKEYAVLYNNNALLTRSTFLYNQLHSLRTKLQNSNGWDRFSEWEAVR